MKILLIGGGGLVGSALHHVFNWLGHEVVAPTRAEYDILSGSSRPALFTGVAVAVNAAVAKPPAERAVASRFPHELSRGCAAAGVKLIHVSTDGVFDGSRGPYEEFSCYAPRRLRHRSNGFVTFGFFNQITKFTDEVIDV
jgi:dTDP-4-dehydrorhamnose reductase